jgi:hypothetical protein
MKNRPVDPAYFDLFGASLYTGGALSVRSLRRLISRPDGLPHYRIGQGKILVKKSELDAFLEAHKQTPANLDAMADQAVREFRGSR